MKRLCFDQKCRGSDEKGKTTSLFDAVIFAMQRQVSEQGCRFYNKLGIKSLLS